MEKYVMIGGPCDGEYATFDDDAPPMIEIPIIKYIKVKEEEYDVMHSPKFTYHKYYLGGFKDVMQNVVYTYISEDLASYDALKMLVNNYTRLEDKN